MQLAADDMHKAIGQSSDNIKIIRDSVREGFRLGTEDKHMSDDTHGFGHLIASSEGVEDSHWRSFVDVMMLIVIIFLR